MRTAPLSIALASLALTVALRAQDSPTTTLQPGSGVLPPAIPAQLDMPDIPMPPRGILGVPPKGEVPPVPVGPASWEPDPGEPTWPGGGQAGPTAAVQVYRNTVVRPSGASPSSVGEPSTSKLDHITQILQTGNWYAARSTNNGGTWSYINPYTLFGAVDGGFCCDQATIAHQGADITVWLLQYLFSASTNRGSIILGIGPDTAGANFGYRFDPSQVGFPAGNWFDFPHLAVSNNYVFFASNVFSGSSNAYQGSVVMRLNAAQLRTGGTVNYNYYKSDSGTASSQRFGSARFAIGINGNTPTMYWASHVNTTTLRIFSWPDSGSMTVRDRAIGTWYSGSTPAPGPDGRNWTGRADNRIAGGAQGAQGTIMWAWHSNAGGSFPRNFTRMVRFLSNFTLNDERTIWNPGYAFMYPSLAPSSVGHIGGTISVGGGTVYPGSLAFIMDDLNGFGSLDNNWVVGGTHGPATAIWGDYFWTQYVGGNKWIGTGFAQVGGTANGNSEHHNAEFGRQDLTTPTVRTLSIASSPVAGAAFTMSTWDYGMLQNGTTSATRTFRNGTAVSVTAATSLGGRPFYRWLVGSTGQTVGQRTLALTMGSNQSITAVYGTFTAGTYTTYGTGCPGTNNQVPTHTGGGTPEIGRPMSWDVNSIVGNTAGALDFGVRQAPLPLAFLGMGTCTLDVNIAAVFSIGIDASRVGRLSFTVPNDMALIGARVATQGAIFDLGAPTPTKVVQTAGLETRVGGLAQ